MNKWSHLPNAHLIDWLEENINPATLKEPMYVEGTGWSFKDRIVLQLLLRSFFYA